MFKQSFCVVKTLRKHLNTVPRTRGLGFAWLKFPFTTSKCNYQRTRYKRGKALAALLSLIISTLELFSLFAKMHLKSSEYVAIFHLD